MRLFFPAEVHNKIKQTNPHMAPGYDLIIGEILKNFLRKAVVLLTIIYNSILKVIYRFNRNMSNNYDLKIGKSAYRTYNFQTDKSPPTNVKDYALDNIMPDHQFGVRETFSTIHQCHIIVNKIKKCLENKDIMRFGVHGCKKV